MRILFPGAPPAPTALCPLAPADVISGVHPRQHARQCTSAAGISSGTWSSEAGHFNWTYYVDEVIFITHGSAMIRDYADPLGRWNHVSVGDEVHFIAGTRAEWYVPEYIQKRFVMIRPPFASRVALRIKKCLAKFIGSPISARQGELT